MRRHPLRDESGVTLIETLIVVVILGIIAFPLAGILTAGLVIPTQEQQRISDTGNAQLLQSFFVNDVQEASTFDTTSTCSGASGVLLAMHWTDQVPSTTNVILTSSDLTSVAKTVDYEMSPSGNELIRRYCDSTAPTSSATVTVLESLQTNPTFSCAGFLCSVTAVEKGTRSDAIPYSFTLSATRRNSA